MAYLRTIRTNFSWNDQIRRRRCTDDIWYKDPAKGIWETYWDEHFNW